MKLRYEISPPGPWTDEMTETAKRMWTDGCNADQIGRSINKSRSAVLGRLHRLGIKRVAPQVGGAEIKRTVQVGDRLRKKLLPPVKAAAPSEGGIGVMDLKYWSTCAYPIAGSGEDLRYCGAASNGGVYCPTHQKIMYQPSNHKRRL